MRKKLDVWPALPIVPFDDVCVLTWVTYGLDNTKAALECNERVSQIDLPITGVIRDRLDVFAALEKPFPALTDLTLLVEGSPDPIFPNPVKFLGFFTRLQSLSLTLLRIPNLFQYSTDLVNIHLNRIPFTAFVSPEAIVTALSTLTRLKVLRLELRVEFDQSLPDLENRRLPLPTRAVLPSLTVLGFKNVNEYYLEDFMARIDAPQLDHLNTVFYSFNQVIFDTPQLLQLISRIPKLQVPVEAYIGFWIPRVCIKFSSPTQASSNVLTLGIICVPPEPHLSCLAQFCHPPFFPLPTLEDLYIGHNYHQPDELEVNFITQWLELFQPFTSVKNLYLAEEYASVLQKLVREGATEVLPMLENVFLERFQPSELVHEASGQFIATRQLSGRPIVISRWD
jgi:hypothetical protein